MDQAPYVAKYQEKPDEVDFCAATSAGKRAVYRCIYGDMHLIEDCAGGRDSHTACDIKAGRGKGKRETGPFHYCNFIHSILQ